MPKDFRELTLRERLLSLPPFLCIALSHVRSTRQTYEQNLKRLWSYEARKKRWKRALKGRELVPLKQWRRMTCAEIAVKSGNQIVEKTVTRLTSHLSWKNIPVTTMLALMEGCGVSVIHRFNSHQRLKYQKKVGRMFTHLDTRQMRHFLRCLKRWKEMQENAR